MAKGHCDVFISHSSLDRDLAEGLVAAIRAATNISARRVRCTSADGYRLAAGAPIDGTLRAEILGTTTFVGLLTPAAMESAYVLFELGARWGTNAPLFPVLARGLALHALSAPIAALNVLALHERAQVCQLLENIAEALAQPLEPLAAFEGLVDTVISLARDAQPDTVERVILPLSEDELRILKFTAEKGWSGEPLLAQEFGLTNGKVDYYVHRLLDAGLLFTLNNKRYVRDHVPLHVTQRGREMLVALGRL